MKLEIGRRPLNPLYYGNPHGLEKFRATVRSIEAEDPTQAGDEEEATVKGAEVAFGYTDGEGEERTIAVRMERKKLVRLAHALGKLAVKPGSTAETGDLIGDEVDIHIETRNRDGAQRVMRFTSLNGSFGG